MVCVCEGLDASKIRVFLKQMQHHRTSHIYYMRIFTYNNIFIIISLLLASSATWKCNIAQVTQFEVSSVSVAQTITDDLPTEV